MRCECIPRPLKLPFCSMPDPWALLAGKQCLHYVVREKGFPKSLNSSPCSASFPTSILHVPTELTYSKVYAKCVVFLIKSLIGSSFPTKFKPSHLPLYVGPFQGQAQMSFLGLSPSTNTKHFSQRILAILCRQGVFWPWYFISPCLFSPLQSLPILQIASQGHLQCP